MWHLSRDLWRVKKWVGTKKKKRNEWKGELEKEKKQYLLEFTAQMYFPCVGPYPQKNQAVNLF